MSDPKCKCPTSFFSPHRVSKCLVRKAVNSDREIAQQKKEHADAVENMRLATEESLRVKERDAENLRKLVDATVFENSSLKAAVSAKERETEVERLKRVQVEKDNLSLLHNVRAHEEQQDMERIRHEKTVAAERKKAKADSEKLSNLVNMVRSENTALQSAVSVKERETAHERMRFEQAEEDRINMEKHLVNSHKELDATTDKLRMIEHNHAIAEQMILETRKEVESEKQTRQQIEFEKQCLLNCVKLQADQNAQEKERIERQLVVEQDKVREAERKKAILIAMIQSDLDQHV